MNAHLEPVNGSATSPFDSIKHTRPDGTEYWSARDLMPLMGYPRWNEFKVPLDRAMTAAKNQGHNVTDLFRGSAEKTGGRPREDYELSRFAAYLVAMNGDPNKPEVAAAQAYFAIQTHVAETTKSPAELTRREILTMALEAEERAEIAEKQAAEQEAIARQHATRLELAAPKVAKADAHSGVTEWKGKQNFYREVQQWGDLQGLDIKQKDIGVMLTRKGMFIAGGRHDSGQITRQSVRNGWGKNEKGVAENGHAYCRPLLSPKGQDIAWKWAVKALEQYGPTLNPIKEEN